MFCQDAQILAEEIADKEVDVVYLDPPYNQHPYGSNYHVLNTITLWDKPQLSKQISRGTKSAIRTDWRTKRKSAYNYKEEASDAYAKLLRTINAHYILTSYSTDGTISLDDMLLANVERGHVQVEMRGYKRYRVSSQRFSAKPMNVEFVLVLDIHKKSQVSVQQIKNSIESTEESILDSHPEHQNRKQHQLVLF